MFQGCLPLVLMFDVKEELEMDPGLYLSSPYNSVLVNVKITYRNLTHVLVNPAVCGAVVTSIDNSSLNNECFVIIILV